MGLLHRHAGFEAADNIKILEVLDGSAIPVRGWHLLFHCERDPQIGSRADCGTKEFSRSDADYRESDIVDRDRFTNGGRIAAESLLPPYITDYSNRMTTRILIVGFIQHAAEAGINSQHGEVTAGDELHLHLLDVAAR